MLSKPILFKSFFAACLYCFFSICSPAQPIKFEYALTIGKTESDSTEYLFSGPKEIVTDTRSRVYIADGSGNSIRVFNKQGRFINSVGGRGRGPGEFLSIDHMAIDDKNNLYVLDRLSRRVSVCSTSPSDQETYSIEANFTDPFALYPLSNKNYIVLATGANSPGDKLKLAFLFGDEFREIKYNFLPVYPTIFESNEPFFQAISASPSYNSTLFGNSLVAVSHEYFSGKIVVFDPAQETLEYILGKWDTANYNRLDWNKRNQYRNRGMRSLVFTSRGGGLAFQVKKRSNGLVGNWRYLVHFYSSVEDKKMLSKVDVYDTQGNLLGTHELTDTDLSLYKKHGNGRVSLQPMYMDEQNQIYFADYTKGMGFPVVRVVKMKVE